MANAPVVAILRMSLQQAVLRDAELELAEIDLHMVGADRDLDAFLLLEELVVVPVQPLGVDRIERVLHHLKPVHRQLRATQHADRAAGDETVETRQQRRGLGAQVGEHEATQLLHRIGIDGHLVAERAVVDLVRLLDALASHVELPAVVRATDALGRGDAVQERRAPVGAALRDQAQFALAVAEQHQAFAQQPHRPRPLAVHVGHRANRVPVPPHQLAHGCAFAHLGQELVAFSRFHRSSPIEGFGQI